MITENGNRICDKEIWSTKRKFWCGCRKPAVSNVESKWLISGLDYCANHAAAAMQTNFCDKCDAPTTHDENEYGEFICADCEQNATEAAYERHCEAFHDGGSTQFISLREQQIAALRFK